MSSTETPARQATISVVIPAFNLEALIGITLRSALAQTSPADEIIVVDDGSTDGTVGVIRQLMDASNQAPIRLVTRSHEGPGATRNAGVAVAASDWVAFLDGDDLWMPEKLQRVREAIARNPDATMIAHDSIERAVDGRETHFALHRKYDREAPLLPQLYRGNFLSTSAMTVRRAEFDEVGGFDPALAAAQDFDLWLTLARAGRLAFVPEPLERYVLRAGSVSSNILARYTCLMTIAHRHAPYVRNIEGALRAYVLRLRLIAIIYLWTAQRLLATRSWRLLPPIAGQVFGREIWRALVPVRAAATTMSPAAGIAPAPRESSGPGAIGHRAIIAMKPRTAIGAVHHLTRGVQLRRRRGAIRIISYHHVPASDLANVRAQLELVGRHCRFITPSEFERMMSGDEPVEGMNVLVTFDDGFASQAEAAVRVLAPLGIKGLFFVPTGFIGLDASEARRFVRERLLITAGDAAPDERRPMTWSDIRALRTDGHVIGAHTRSHPRLPDIASTDMLEQEIIAPAGVLERELGSRVDHFAYTFGSINDISPAAVGVAVRRFTYCYSGIRGTNDPGPSRQALLRDPIDSDDPPAYVSFLTERGLDTYYRRRASVLTSMLQAACQAVP